MVCNFNLKTYEEINLTDCWKYSPFSPTKTDDFSTALLLPSLLQTLEQIDLIHTLIDQYPQRLALAECADDVFSIFRSGRVASLIGVEGLHQIANSVSVIRIYHRLGIRYMTLCHDSNTRWADAAVSRILVRCRSGEGRWVRSAWFERFGDIEEKKNGLLLMLLCFTRHLLPNPMVGFRKLEAICCWR